MRSNRLGWILLAPTMIILFLFGVVPFLYIIWLSFHQWNPAAVNPDIIFIGADNFRKLVFDAGFLASLGVTLTFVTFAVLSELVIGYLLAQAFMVGSGLLLVLGPFMSYGDLRVPLLVGLLAGTVLHLMFVMIEIRGHHGTDNAQAGVKIMTGARYGSTLQLGNGIAVVAAVLALAGFFVGGLWLGALGGIAAQVALLMYEHVFVRAGQEVPLS